MKKTNWQTELNKAMENSYNGRPIQWEPPTTEAKEWENEFCDRFCGTGRFTDFKSYQEVLAFVKGLLASSRLQTLQEIKEWAEKSKKNYPPMIAPIGGGLNLGAFHGVDGYNLALDDLASFLNRKGEMK